MLRSKRFWSSLIIFVWLLLIRQFPIFSLAGIILTGGISYPKTLVPFRHFKFWIPIIVLMLMVPLFTGTKDAIFLGVSYSTSQFFLSLGMAIRGIAIYEFFAVLTSEINSERFSKRFEKLNLTLLDQMMRIGREVFPRVKNIYNARFAEIRTSKQLLNPRYMLKNFAVVLADITRLSNELSIDHDTSISPQKMISKVNSENASSIVLVTGDAGAGKTPWIESLVEELLKENIQVDGFISKKESIDDENWFHHLVRISTGESVPLNSMKPSESSPQTGKFFFNQSAFDWAENQTKELHNSEWIILDEFGQLELNNSGLFPVLKNIVSQTKCHLVLSVRPSIENEVSLFLSSSFPTFRHHKIIVIPVYTKSPIIE